MMMKIFAHTMAAARGNDVGSTSLDPMVSRFRWYLLKALQCERLAATVSGDSIKTTYLELAREWRELARQAEFLRWDYGSQD
jgi:hypothetical protein